MKKIVISLTAMIFFLVISADFVLADRGNRSGVYRDRGRDYGHGYKYRGPVSHKYSYKRHIHRYGWDGPAFGLGIGFMGSRFINRYPREKVVVIEHNRYFPAPPAPPPKYRGDCSWCPDRSYAPPSRVWVPGHYIQEKGRYKYIQGRWQE